VTFKSEHKHSCGINETNSCWPSLSDFAASVALFWYCYNENNKHLRTKLIAAMHRRILRVVFFVQLNITAPWYVKLQRVYSDFLIFDLI